MKPLKEKISITIDQDILQELKINAIGTSCGIMAPPWIILPNPLVLLSAVVRLVY